MDIDKIIQDKIIQETTNNQIDPQIKIRNKEINKFNSNKILRAIATSLFIIFFVALTNHYYPTIPNNPKEPFATYLENQTNFCHRIELYSIVSLSYTTYLLLSSILLFPPKYNENK